MSKNKIINKICYTVLVFLGLYLAMFQRILDQIALAYTSNKIIMGSFVTTHFLGLLIGPIICGELSDKYGRKKIVIAAFAVFAIGLLCMTLFNQIAIALLGIFLIGAGFGVLEGTVSALLTDLSPQNASKVMNLSQMFFSLGTVAGPFVILLVLSQDLSWKYVYAVFVAQIILFIYLFAKHPSDVSSNIETEKKTGSATLHLLKQKKFLIFCLSMIMYVGIEEGLAFWITTYAKEGPSNIFYPSAVLAIFWFGMVVGRYITSKINSNPNEFIVIGSTISGIFIVLSLVTNLPWFMIITFFFIGLGFSCTWPMIMVLVKEYSPQNTGAAFGIMLSCCAIGGITIPWLMGYIAESVNMKWAVASCLLPVVVIVINHIYLKNKCPKPCCAEETV